MQALWMLFASVMFAIMGASVKLAAAGLPLPEVVLMRGLPIVIVLLIWARRSGRSLIPPSWRLHAVRNISGIASMWMSFYAISHLSLATATSLSYTSPLFIAAWVMWRSNTRDSLRIAALFIGFIGVLILLRPSVTEDQWVPAMIGLAGGALMAVAYLGLRVLGQAGEPEWRTVFYFALSASLSGLVMLPVTGWVSPGMDGWLALLSMAGSGMLGQFAVTRAFGRGSALLSAALQYSTIVFSAGLGYLFWNDAPDALGWAGMGLIVLAGLISTWCTRRDKGKA
ncbi:DMT family transporter [Pigmentiphaga aceris]|uniref:DMT family transporter n=1 Tax=Pigmentiphaga aceris TaxID=1940612 RepID=A0A5C0B2D8_9BURK|nr:DMT family transporter [Pigmentiphaga aceris]QEI07340.1 DMT family transporter [Pigmentiphaga aceris]